MCKPQIGADCWEQPRDNIFTRRRLRRILRAMGIERIEVWQRRFLFDELEGTVHVARKNGKLTICKDEAVILCAVRLAMWYRGVIDRSDILCAKVLGAPDYYAASSRNRSYYLQVIEWAHAQCVAHGIRVFRFKDDKRKRWWRP